MVENFPPVPWRGTGGIMKEEKKEVPRLNGKEFKIFSFLLPVGGGGISSPCGRGQGAGFVPYPEGLVRPGKRENRVLRGDFYGGEGERKVNKNEGEKGIEEKKIFKRDKN